MNTAVFVDGNWLLHRAYHTIGKRSSIPTKRVPIQIVSWVYASLVRWNARHCIVAFDGNSVFRYKMYPEYKATRKAGSKEHSDVYDSLDPTILLLRRLGIRVEHVPEFEADDVIVSASDRWSNYFGGNSIILSKDKDVLGYVGDRIRVYTPGTNNTAEVVWDTKKVVREKGCTPSQWVDVQTLAGDSIDDIPCLMSLSKAKALVKQYGSLKSYCLGEGSEWFKENKSKVVLNRRLVTLRKDAIAIEEAEDLVVPKPSVDAIDDYGSMPASAVAYSMMAKPRKTLF